MNVRNWVAVFAAGMALFSAIPAQAGTPPPPAADFIRPPAIDEAIISPDGERLAVLMPGRDGYMQLGVIDLKPLGKPRVVGAFADADVQDVRWVNDHRLVYWAHQRAVMVQRGGAGVFAVNDDGTHQRQLVAWLSSGVDLSNVAISSKLLPYGWFVSGTLGDGSADVLMARRVVTNAGEVQGYTVSRLDTLTGNRQSLSQGWPDHVHRWLLDGKYEPQAVETVTGAQRQVWLREDDAKGWRQIAQFDEYGENPGFSLWHLEPDGRVYVVSRQGQDTDGLYTLDRKTGRVDPEPVLLLKGFDLEARPQVDSRTRRLVGVRIHADTWRTYWLDARLASIQKGIDAALPGRINRLLCGACESTQRFVVHSSSDRQPGQYLMFDAGKGTLEPIGFARPWIDEASQGRRSFHRIKARDGLELPLYVTHPAGAKPDQPLPAVVVVHGGPWARGGGLGWNGEAQFLASRGYRVLEPEFRGSTGYGWTLFRAGWKQWGQAMQDDLADTVRWAAAQGLVDPARVCVMGGSYGGYAALMAPIATPGVFRCAISFAGVTDIDSMYTVSWSDLSEQWKRYGMPVMIGDPAKDREMLARASPLLRVAEIKVPLLVVQGGEDQRVPIVHARQFLSAAKGAGLKVEELIYPDEGHGFAKPENHADYLKHVEDFLGRHIGPAR